MTRPIFSQDGTYGSAVCVTGFNLVVFTCACKNERIQAATCYIAYISLLRVDESIIFFIFLYLSVCLSAVPF